MAILPPDAVKKVIQEDLEHVWHPLAQHRALEQKPPLLLVAGSGATVRDASGKEYLDALAGLYCVNVGYGREEIARAAYEQMRQLAYYPHTQANVPAAEFADRLSRLVHGGLKHVYFVNSGTEANEAAYKFALQYHKQTGNPGKYKIIGRYYAYHGTSLSTLAAGGIPDRKVKYEPMPQGFRHAPPPYCYRCPFKLEPSACGLACANYIEYMIEAEGAETVAAVVMEPIMSASGVLVPPDGYLPRVQEICRRHNVLLIIDEVINGFGRTGAWFAHQHYGVEPDILCVAKGISSAYLPLAATLVTDQVFAAFKGEVGEMRHAVQVNTYGGHPAACAAGLKNLEIMISEDLPRRSAEMGAYLLVRFQELQARHACIGDVRGKGLFLGLELVRDRGTRAPLDPAAVNKVAADLLEQGIIVGKSTWVIRGLYNSLIFSPPLVLTRAEADRIVAALDQVLAGVGE